MYFQDRHFEIIDQRHNGKNQGRQKSCQGDALGQTDKGAENQVSDDGTQEECPVVFLQQGGKQFVRLKSQAIAGIGQV